MCREEKLWTAPWERQSPDWRVFECHPEIPLQKARRKREAADANREIGAPSNTEQLNIPALHGSITAAGESSFCGAVRLRARRIISLEESWKFVRFDKQCKRSSSEDWF
jgi:hypothetical protein